ncbi:MAG: ABC transporter permease [Clostridium sp.]|jgi:putative ABC transport system permease protein|nr:ABC transporter permease [Clostridium sp.]
MKYFFRKTCRDMLGSWMQFFAVLAMSFLSVCIYSGIEGVWYGLDRVASDYYEQTAIADYRIYCEGVSETQLDEIQGIGQVEAASVSMSVNVGFQDALPGNGNPVLRLRTFRESDRVSTFLTQEGNVFSETPADAVWLDLSFAQAHDIETGDTVKLSFSYPPSVISETGRTGDRLSASGFTYSLAGMEQSAENTLPAVISLEKELTVEGLVLSSEYIYDTGSATEIVPNHELYGYCFVSEQTARQFLGTLIYHEIRLKTGRDADTAVLRKELERILGESYRDMVEKDDIPAVSQITKEVRQMKTMAQRFSFVFILLALLTMYTTMSRLVHLQSMEIGLFKALGFSNSFLRLHYALYGFIVSALGGFLGSVFGPIIVSPAVMALKKATLVLPRWETRTSYATCLLVAAITVVCTCSCLAASRRSLTEVPAVSMRTKPPKEGTESFFEKIPFLWSLFSSAWRWIFRDVSRAKLRTLIGIVGVAGGLTLIVAGVGVRDSIRSSNEYVYHVQNRYQEKLLLASAASDEDKALIEERTDKGQWLMEQAAEFTAAGDSRKGLLTVADGMDLLYFEDPDRKPVKLSEDGVLLTRKLAERLGAQAGEEIRFRVIGTQLTLTAKIAQIIYSPAPQGIFIARKYFEAIGGDFAADSILISNEAQGRSYSDIPSVREIVTIEAQEENMNTMLRSVMTIIGLLIVASLVLSSVILYNLGTLNFMERRREYATMQVLGFYQKEIRSLMLRENVLILTAGLLLGAPVSLKFLEGYLGIIAFDSFEWIPQIHPLSFALCVGVIALCSVATTLVLSWKAGNIVMAESLKSME